MFKKSFVFLVISILLFNNCNEIKSPQDMLSKKVDDPIIGEWYLVGRDNGQFGMIKPFTKGIDVNSYIFRKDSFDIYTKKGQILNSLYKLINEGENVKTHSTYKYEKSGDTYLFSDKIFGEVVGDTLKIYNAMTDSWTSITYFFKKKPKN